MTKPCEGRFSEELQEILTRNRDRAQWAVHRCEVCGLEIGAKLDKGKWVPEQHWPTVKYRPRAISEKKTKIRTGERFPDQVIAGSGPR